MKIHSLLYLCAIFFLSTVNSFALGQAASMGNLQTVVPSGPFDTARNPALLAAQTSTNSTGLFYSYIMHFPKEESAYGHRYDGTTSTDYNNNIKLEEPEIKGMSVNLANSTKFGNSTIGFAITNNGDDQYSVEERGMSSIVSGGSLFSTSNEKSKKTMVNPAVITSVGFNISKTSSIGFQLLAKYSSTIEKKEYYENQTTPTIYIKSERIKKEDNKLSGELGFGYFFNADNSEIGFQIRTGDFSWIKKSISVDSNRISAGTSSSADESINLNGKHTSGPSITAGGYKRLSSFFALGLESRFTIQNSFTNKELDIDDDQTNPIKVKIKKNTQITEHSIMFNGGIEFNLSKSLSFNTGLGYSKVTTESNEGEMNSSSRQGNNIQYTFLTAGFTYFVSPNIKISLIGLVISYQMNGYNYGESDTSPNDSHFNSEMKFKGYYVHTGLGIIMSF
jgi:hypothetical protein